MLYVYCSRPSGGARELVEALGATRLRNFDGMSFWQKGKRVKIREGDAVVCWGNPLPQLEGIRVLNGADHINKFKAAEKFAAENVPTVQVRLVKPSLSTGLWLPRRNDHVGGDDLINPGRADFWAKKEEIVREFRVHAFGKRSIRAGMKIPREGFLALNHAPGASENEILEELRQAIRRGRQVYHPWIRSFDAGWRINYNGFDSTPVMKKLAKKAVKVLGLNFGAVDLGERADGKLIVLEVNRAPGLEGNSIGRYAEYIRKWSNGPERTEERDSDE